MAPLLSPRQEQRQNSIGLLVVKYFSTQSIHKPASLPNSGGKPDELRRFIPGSPAELQSVIGAFSQEDFQS